MSELAKSSHSDLSWAGRDTALGPAKAQFDGN